MKKRILCYGDSNTYGFNPYDGSRYSENERWSGILKNELSNDYEVIEEGQNNRTAVVDNPAGFDYSAQRHFPKLLSKLKEIDILILAIGTNDLQFLFDISFKNIEKGLEELILTAKKHKVKNIIIVPPVKISDDILKGYFNCQFDETSITKSRQADKIYKKLARIYKCNYIDFNNFVKPSTADGLHYEPYSHVIIANKLKELIEKLS